MIGDPRTGPSVTFDDLFRLLGQKEAEIAFLRALVARLEVEVAARSAPPPPVREVKP